MSRPGFADRELLKGWADTIQAQSQLPRLIRRLILETTPGLLRLGMPADEGVAAGGWDGSVRAEAASPWVPAGLSVWELSVNSSPGTKADDDYSKRAATPDGTEPGQAVYIEAILRPWTAREEWATKRRADKRWQDVRAYGLDDIATWLEAAPVSWAWFSEELGLSPYGLQTGSTFWQHWSTQTIPALTPGIVLAGRQSNVRDLDEALPGPGIKTISGASLDEVKAFVAARAVQVDATGDGRALARLAFVDDLAAWRRLLESLLPLLLVPRDPVFAHEVTATTIHSVLVPVEGNEGDINLTPLDRAAVAESLTSAGVEDHQRADALGALARRSLTALRRNLAVKSALHRPTWAGPASRSVRGMLLAGRWDAQVSADREVLRNLTGLESEPLQEKVLHLSNPGDPFVSRSGSLVHVVSPVDAWLLLAPVLTENDLTQLKTAVDTVLGEDDPALDIAPAERWWKPSVEGRRRAHSPHLARGLATTLALLGTYGDRVLTPGGSSGVEWAESIVRDVLAAANSDSTGRRWAEIAGHLPLLAEAAPEAFMSALATTTRAADPLAKRFFTDGQNNSFNSVHTHVLWALETIAWSPEYYSQAVDLLARLDGLDPGGRLSNRPAVTLANLLRPWPRYSAATAATRRTVLDNLRRRHPLTAWELGLALLPDQRAVYGPNASPAYREWKPADASVARAEYLEFVTAVVERSVVDAGPDPARWAQLLEQYDDLPANDQTRVREALKAHVDNGAFSEEGRLQVWNRLRDLAGQHREFADAAWSLPEEEVAKLDPLIQALAPMSARNRHEWLFQDWMPHLGDADLREDHAAYDALLASRREQAVGDIVDEGGLDAVLELVSSVEVSHSVGWALGRSRPTFDDALLGSLESDQHSDLLLGEQYFARRFRDDGWSWLSDLIEQHAELSSAQRGRLLLATRDFPQSWEVASEHPDVEEFFWKHFSPFGLGADFGHIEFVATNLMRVRRYAAALHFLNLYVAHGNEPGPGRLALILEGLEGLLGTQDDEEIRTLRTHDFKSLFELLDQNHAVLDVSRLATLEWAYLPVLGHDAKVGVLSAQLATTPVLFVDVVCLVYRRRDGTDAEHSLGRGRETAASTAYRLLTNWSQPPGLANGTMNADALRTWLDAVEPLLQERDRLETGLQQVGQILASTPADSDGTWPGEVVREVLEERQDEHIEMGLYLAVLNRRGATIRGLVEGGRQERELAEKFYADAAHVVDAAPRSAALLRRIARNYSIDARREEDDAERFRRDLE